MNYHAFAPGKYKKSVGVGLEDRVYNACSSWSIFYECLNRPKKMLEKNQYPPNFYNPIIKRNISKIVTPEHKEFEKPEEQESEETRKTYIQYRGKVTDKFIEALNRVKAPATMITAITKFVYTCLHVYIAQGTC